MIVNITSLSESEDLNISYEELLKLPDGYNLFDNNAKVKVEGGLKKHNNLITLDAYVTTNIYFRCDKCLAKVEKVLEFPIKEVFSSIETDDDEIWFFKYKEIDLDPCIISNICSEIPVKILCNEDCKGLCKICGCNLNLENCDCEEVIIDDRFAVLKDLFKDDKEV